MGVIGKSFGFVMLPISLLIFMQTQGKDYLPLPVDKLLIGSILMVALQVLTIYFLHVNHSKLSVMNYVIAISFCLPALFYFWLLINGIFLPSYVPLILAAFMFAESMYALA